MKIRRQKGLIGTQGLIHHMPVILIILFLIPSVRGEYSIDWESIDGGGSVCSGGSYVMVGTIGQAESDIISDGDAVLSGGYWPGSTGCVVNLVDLTIFVEQWLSVDPLSTADFDESGRVNFFDFSELAYWWLYDCPVGWPLK